MEQILWDVAQNSNLEEGPLPLEKMLLHIFLHPGVGNKAVARELMLPIPVVTALKKEFIKAGLLCQDRGIRCTEEGQVFVKDSLGYRGLNQELWRTALADISDTSWFDPYREELDAIFEARPRVDVTLDQSKVTSNTSLRRALLCLRQNALIGKDILCVGDDDLVSVSLCMLLKALFPAAAKMPVQVTVVDVDQRFIDFIQEIAHRHDLPISCEQWDLRKPLPDTLSAKFDCFFTDPPYTLSGMGLFVSRGISGLKKIKGIPIFLSFAHKSLDVRFQMQQELSSMGLLIDQILARFNQYEGAEILGNEGQMMVLRTTERTRPLIDGDFEEHMYTGERAPTIRVYQCKHCNKLVTVGQGCEITSIEALKEYGCPDCDNHTFNLREKKAGEVRV